MKIFILIACIALLFVFIVRPLWMPNPERKTEVDVQFKHIKSGLDSIGMLHNQIFQLLAIGRVRDSFVAVSKEYEILYYKTGKRIYAVKHDRLVDSIHKYCHIADSVATSMIHK